MRGGGVGLFFLFIEIALFDRQEESVEWSREFMAVFPLVINCCENVTLDGPFVEV